MPSTRTYVIGNDNEKTQKTVRETEGGDIRIIGLVPNMVHTANTVYVKNKDIKSINTFRTDCDLGKEVGQSSTRPIAEELSPKAQTRRLVRSLAVFLLFVTILCFYVFRSRFFCLRAQCHHVCFFNLLFSCLICNFALRYTRVARFETVAPGLRHVTMDTGTFEMSAFAFYSTRPQRIVWVQEH